jgi:streptogramin lyase
MYFTGEQNYCYVYDPEVGDWTGRFAKPKGMVYGGCFYTLTCGTAPLGLVCWTQHGELLRLDSAKKVWAAFPLTGAKLPGTSVDNATVIYDSKRDRLLLTRRDYADKDNFDGEIYEVDLKTYKVRPLTAAGREGVKQVRFLREAAYDAGNDLVLFGFLLPPGDDGVRRTLAYDPAGNRWVSLKLPGSDPNGKEGRNVSLGLMYDAKRKLFWAVDTNSNVYVVKLDPKTADVQVLK